MKNDRRITITQTPYVHEYAAKLASETGISRADIFNTAVQLLSVTLGVYAAGNEYAVRYKAEQMFREDPAIKILLGDLLILLQNSER